jgi:adenylosuccinate synthase
MPATAVVGVQWGDEGKGKIIDILASRSEVVVRAQGGNNAGHTINSGSEVYKLSLLPSGVLYPHVSCLIGCGVVIDPGSLLTEMDGLIARGIPCQNLQIDARAHIVMPWHRLLDGILENNLGGSKIGTTRRGIGPCYMDKAARTGIRLCDLVNPELFPRKARAAYRLAGDIITKIYGGEPLDIGAVIEEYSGYGKRLAEYAGDVSVMVWEAVRAGKKVLFEGAQGTLLDLNAGTYPFVTSSHPVSGGFCVGAGVGPGCIGQVLGVAKAYTTRVGEGPFPTELPCKTGEALRDSGNEYGTVTGRPRRVGWFDSVILRYATRVNGLSHLAVNKLDVLRGLETLKICTAYKLGDGTVTNNFPPALEDLENASPIYEDFPGFEEDISACRSFAELPENCKKYISYIEESGGCPVSMVGVGPGREQNLERGTGIRL